MFWWLTVFYLKNDENAILELGWWNSLCWNCFVMNMSCSVNFFQIIELKGLGRNFVKICKFQRIGLNFCKMLELEGLGANCIKVSTFRKLGRNYFEIS